MEMAAAQATITHSGNPNEDLCPASINPKTMIPMDLCESFALLDIPRSTAVTTCSLRKSVFTFGVAVLNVRNMRPIKIQPTIRPMIGATNKGRTLYRTPRPRIAWGPLMISVAPTTPPISAWVDEDGMPRHQQKTFHSTAAIMAITMVFSVTAFESTKPVVMERATAAPYRNGATNSATATRYRANRGRIARDAMTPAKILDESR